MSSDTSLKARFEALELRLQKELNEKEILQTQLSHHIIERRERVLLARGEYFAQLQDVLGTETVEYAGGFREICGRILGRDDGRWREKRFPEYTTLELELLAKVTDMNATADDMSYVSESASSRESIARKGGNAKLSKEEKDLIAYKEITKLYRAKSSSGLSRKSGDATDEDSGVKIIDVGTLTNAGHLLAGNPSCSPTMGIFVQAIIGFDFEAKMNEQIKTVLKKEDIEEEKLKELAALTAKRKKVLQSLAYHQRHYRGFCNLANNLVQVPKGGHERYFDQTCVWIIVPIMPFAQIINWHYGMGGYWVMFIAGSFRKRDTQAYINFLQASTSEKEGEHVYVPGVRERCSKTDVELGIANLTAFIKAFADLATGRGERKLTPFDLITETARPSNLEALKAARDELAKRGVVTVPILGAFDEQTTQVLKVHIDHDNPAFLPEPMAVASKGALNFMEMIGEKATPSCGECSVGKESFRDESDTSSIDQISFGTPIAPRQEKSDIPECVSFVTPSP